MPESANNLDQIRDLLFGQQLDAYSHRFTQCGDRLGQIEESLSEFQGQMQTQLQQLDSTIDQELVNLNQGLENKLKHFSIASNNELAKIEQMLNGEMGSFKQELTSFQKDFAQQHSTMKGELEAIRGNLERELNMLKEDIATAWNSRFSETNDGKLAKDQLGKMLFEFSLKTRDEASFQNCPRTFKNKYKPN
ncbi:MAG: hypothetical protein HC799_01755 [Limnothrix sp. RL_2_0]|nr:hypothetical protein [Limnothrix sp. RL_2_0]